MTKQRLAAKKKDQTEANQYLTTLNPTLVYLFQHGLLNLMWCAFPLSKLTLAVVNSDMIACFPTIKDFQAEIGQLYAITSAFFPIWNHGLKHFTSSVLMKSF